MTIWLLNTIGLLATTIGALFVFLHLHRSGRAAPKPLPAECAGLARDRRLLTITMGLLAGWFVIQYAAALFL
jgi:hypothetical protein